MDLLEISEKRTLKREDAAQLLHGIADSPATTAWSSTNRGKY